MSTNDMMASSLPSMRPANLPEGSMPVPRIETRDRTVHIQKISGRVRITPQARRYAVAELARRAGVSDAVQKLWKVIVEEARTIVHLPGVPERQIIFPHASSKLLRGLSAGQASCQRRSWMFSPPASVASIVPSFVVPFADDELPETAGLFVAVDAYTVECTLDLPLSILLSLSRWEETLDVEHDAHGRFSAEHSIAHREGFLARPIVDEYGLAFEQALQLLIPSWVPDERKLHVKLSHDADHVGIPFRLKNALRHTTHYRKPLDSARDFLGLVSPTDPRELRALREIVSLSFPRCLDSSVYWKASLPATRDSGYDPRHPKIRRTIQWLAENNVESGVQPGYDTFRSPARLRREVEILREVLGDGPLGGRQHYLRWCPDTWIHWETCGLAYDSSLCFAELAGFRAGTCIPYRPWLFSLNREADLLEIPLVVMDRTMLGYMKLNREQSLAAILSLIEKCRMVGGVFTLLWHNNSLLNPLYREIYFQLLPLLEGGAKYDWRAAYSSISQSQP
jgi:hypothetical protein